MLYEAVNGGGFRAVLAHELQPRGRVIEQVPNRDDGPRRRSDFFRRAKLPAFHAQTRPRFRVPPAGPRLHPADRANRRQRLPAKAERLNLSKVIGGAYFAGRVT